jgi:shikimate dehydrogenase
VTKGPKLYAVIGDPIDHSLSPVFQNAAFRSLKIPAIYFPWRVTPKSLGAILKSFRRLGVHGFNVTLPLKQVVIRHLDWIDPQARTIGAVNTVCLKGRRLLGYNTDVEGFLNALKVDLGFHPRAKRAVVLGAGGAAKAVVYALVKAKIRSLVIASRRPQRARLLVSDLKKRGLNLAPKLISLHSGLLKDEIRQSDLLINATSLGMHSRDSLPVKGAWIHSGLHVLDLVYGPHPTRLVSQARKKGARAVDGQGMLIGQGAASFRRWTKRRPPIPVMRRELKKWVR